MSKLDQRFYSYSNDKKPGKRNYVKIEQIAVDKDVTRFNKNAPDDDDGMATTLAVTENIILPIIPISARPGRRHAY